MHPKFIIVSRPEEPLVGNFVYGKVNSHRHLVEGYVRVHGDGWYEKDDETKTMLLYGSSGDYGEPRLDFLNRIPSELKGYKFLYSHDWGKTSSELDVSGVVLGESILHFA